jgi:hypothetical protein
MASPSRAAAAAGLIALTLVSSHPISAQVANGSSRDKLVVSSAWLAEHLNDRDLVALQVGRKATCRRKEVGSSQLAVSRASQ